ncbi:MAG: CDP-alcohol phosphatidyltransferase family protein [Myxococcota bacterium]
MLKSRDVEDPINVWVHRPLAYGFVWATFRTSLTPNQVTLMATIVGIIAGGMWLWGTPGAMVAGGILLWTSAILDGADGILARAKKMSSEFGRALDGSADMLVGLVTTLAAFHHAYQKTNDPIYWYLAPVAIGMTVGHVYMYDFYKESYLRFTQINRNSDGGDAPQVAKRIAELEEEGGNLLGRMVLKHGLLSILRAQHAIVTVLNPGALRQGRRFTRNERTVEIYERHNIGPMRLWAIVSVAPHTYIMAMCAMFDHVELYLWIRLFLMNGVFFVALIWQRRATENTMRELADIGAAPVTISVQTAEA